jgi:hypothetical protein
MAGFPAVLLPSDGVETRHVNLHGELQLDFAGVECATYVIQVLRSVVVGQRVLRGSVQDLEACTYDRSLRDSPIPHMGVQSSSKPLPPTASCTRRRCTTTKMPSAPGGPFRAG